MYVAHRNVCSSLEAHLAAVEATLARIPAYCQILYLVYCIVHKVKIRGGSTGTWEQKRILKNRYSVFIQDISHLHSTVSEYTLFLNLKCSGFGWSVLMADYPAPILGIFSRRSFLMVGIVFTFQSISCIVN